MHYYQHHIGDFIRDTSRLSDSQTMAYLRLMWLYYESEKPLPNKPQVLALKIGSTDESVSLILEAFFTLENDEWVHTRCESEIAGYKAICNRNATNGKAGGRPKKTQSVSNGNPDATQTEPHRNPNQEPRTNNHKPITKEEKKESAKPSVVACPPDVDESVWLDWLNLRKAKKAAVTETVINLARWEAEKANMTFEGFLKEWCFRGSQGLKADWLKPHEKTRATAHAGFANKNYNEGIGDDGQIL
jgi:uncharacterized protein YdaU (DUF1376 family)